MTQTVNTPRTSPSGRRILNARVTWPAGVTIPINGQSTQSFAFPGVKVGDVVVVARSSGAPGLIYAALNVIVDDQIRIQASNIGPANPVDPSEEPLEVRIL